MGLFSRIKQSAALAATSVAMLNGDDPIQGAVQGRGVITAVDPTGASVVLRGIERYHCRITLDIALDDTERFTALCTQRMTPWAIARVRPGVTAVAVDVDPADCGRVRIDWDARPPVVRAAGTLSNGNTADVLARGVECTVAMVEADDLGMVDPGGSPMFGLLLAVLPSGATPYQVHVEHSVPPDAIALLYPGARLPATVLPDDRSSVTIDFATALADM